MHRKVRWLFLMLLLLPGGGCITGELTAQLSECEQAAHHMAACMGELPPGQVSASCDLDVARQVLSLDCAQLSANTTDIKSDGFSSALADFACGIGLYRYCPIPTCVPDLDEPLHSAPAVAPEGSSQCAIDALAFEGCGACDYYRCREQEDACGPDGYHLGFGYHYCNAFRLIAERHASPEAQGWLSRVRRCLIETLDRDETEGDCNQLKERAFDSHVECYVKTGFCDLPLSDWLLVVNTVKLRDIDLYQLFATSSECLSAG